MINKIDYNECLINLACSLRKYFNLQYNHNTLSYVDKILEERKPDNVIVLLFDGMGSKVLEKTLDNNSFLLKHKIKDIMTVFPATTVAATTSMMTGYNPCETAMLGWNMYYKDLDKIVTTFYGYEKKDIEKKVLPEAITYKDNNMITKSIMEEINDIGIDRGYILFPFSDDAYKDIDDMFKKIKTITKEKGKKLIYAYDEEPDSSLHKLGVEALTINKLVQERNKKVELLSNQLDDNSLIIVVADHGHISVENFFLIDYPDIESLLEKDISIESRCVNFFIKKGKNKEFERLFNLYFSDDFILYNKEEVINNKLFGDGIENKIFKDIMGDYLAVAISDKTIIGKYDWVMTSQHAGITDDEIYVPLIII